MKDKISISKNFYKGKKIIDIREIVDLSLNKKSLYHRGFGIKPASVILRMQAVYVLYSIENDLLFYIERKN